MMSTTLLLWCGIAFAGILSSGILADEHGSDEFRASHEVSEGRTFQTKPHRQGYRSYYVLHQNNQRQTQQQRQVQRQQQQQQQQPRTRYGIWYPAPKEGVQSGNANTVYQTKLPQKLGEIGANKLGDLVDMADLTETLSEDRFFTVFAPTDSALESFLSAQTDEFRAALTSNEQALKTLLLNHVVPGRVMVSDLKDGMRINTLADNELEVLETKEGLTVGGARIMVPEQRVNFMAENGYVHMIDDVIFPFRAKEEENMEKDMIDSLMAVDDGDPELLVNIKNGPIRGINLGEGHRAWLGIPFAKPPVGDLRFAPPEMVDDWTERLETRERPNACMQNRDTAFGENFEGSDVWNPNTDVSEDCLYLNVYAPRNSSEERLPVLVWIYGGGFATGSSSLAVYNPRQLVERGKLVFVSMQYRLGPHGFLYMGEDSGAPGNQGLLDQVMALEWVQENIGSFNGNPNDVTLMGESAGANSVALHMVSPRSCKLFNKVILQSTGMTPRWGYNTPEKAMMKAEALAKLVDCDVDSDDPSSTVTCLRDADSADLQANEYGVEDYTVNLFPFGPTVDGDFLPASPRTMLENKAFSSDVPVLIGTNANEGFWSLMYFLTDVFPKEELDEMERMLSKDKYEESVAQVFSFYPEVVQKLIALNYRQMVDSGGKDGLFNAIDQMVADSDFVCNTEELAQMLAENGNEVFRYHYDHRASTDAWPTWSGTKHGDEIQLTFGHPLSAPMRYNAEEVSFARELVTFWTNFVKSGSPNPSSFLKTWPMYQSPKWQYMNLTAGGWGSHIDQMKMADKCEFWLDVLPELVNDDDDDDDKEMEDVDLDMCK